MIEFEFVSHDTVFAPLSLSIYIEKVLSLLFFFLGVGVVEDDYGRGADARTKRQRRKDLCFCSSATFK